MRVIAGTARGTKLRSPSTTETVPITDRAKEALFNILYPTTRDSRFLDMFAGTGGVGIEALSRGAKHATFVEISDKIFEDLKWNIDRTRCKDRATLINTDAFEYVVKSKEKFDIIKVARKMLIYPGSCIGILRTQITVLIYEGGRFNEKDEEKRRNTAFLV